jgi:hypothetical protein
LAFFTVFFAFFAFLAIVSSQGFNGLKRDTRDARQRASLATSSNVIPADSRGAALRCHARVIALSTAVVRFQAAFGAKVSPCDVGFGERLRGNQFKSSRIQNQGSGLAARIDAPLIGAIACYRQNYGAGRHRFDRVRDKTMQVLELQC